MQKISADQAWFLTETICPRKIGNVGSTEPEVVVVTAGLMEHLGQIDCGGGLLTEAEVAHRGLHFVFLSLALVMARLMNQRASSGLHHRMER